MNIFKKSFFKLSVESWIFGLTGFFTFLFSIIGFFGLWPFDQIQTIQILLAAIGMLMIEVVALKSQRHSEIKQLKNLLNISDSKFVDAGQDYTQALVLDLFRSKKFVLDTYVNWTKPRLDGTTYLSGIQHDFYRVLFERLKKDKLSFRQVHMIYHKEGLVEVIHRLLLYEGKNYFIRHYDPPPISVPLIHIVSFDDESFYLGVGYPRGGPMDNKVIFIREPKITHLLKNYWHVFWEYAIPLNEGKIINWNELKKIGIRIGIQENEFDSIVEKVKEDVKRDKRLLKK